MRKQLLFCTGGCRSGKSRFALKWAEEKGGERLFVATAAPSDEATQRRILAHQEERTEGWRTLEVFGEDARRLDVMVSEAIAGFENIENAVCVIDCLSAWVGFAKDFVRHKPQREAEEFLLSITGRALDLLKGAGVPTAVVSIETGLGMADITEERRYYLDLLGRLNQMVAARSTEALLFVSGLPVKLK